ncbi:DUF4446 family protein [Candidatus Parcubacteria bacterium]|nr:DUF4446 family protein [Candidatus Parcubacteria bacterium]
MVIDPNIVLYSLIGIVAVLVALVIYMEVRVRRLLRGKDAQTLEDSLAELMKETDALHKSREEIENYLKQVEGRLRRGISGVGTVRFNPFQGSSGSNQSFATAFVNEKGDGVVFSSLYSRDRVSVYAKPLKAGSSEYELTEEEKRAIAKTKE